MALQERLLRWIFPLTCYSCAEDLAEGDGGPLCPRCLGAVRFIEAPYCQRCGVPLPDGGAHCFECRDKGGGPLRRVRAAAAYGPELAGVVHAFKYEARKHLAAALGEWLARAYGRYPELSRGEVLAPVPLHARRRRERGFNQAEELARVLAAQARLPLSGLLERVRSTRPQVGLGRAQRADNVREAFAALPEAKGARVLLVDDLCTTGATLEACARALRKAGARSVDALVLARQPAGLL